MRPEKMRVILALGLWWICAPAIVAIDISVTGIEVTQAIQFLPGNSVKLVADRSMVVRATLGVTGSASPVTGVTGSLRISVGGVPGAIYLPDRVPFTAPLSPQRAQASDTMNFRIPAMASLTGVDFVVTVTVAGDTNASNDSGSLTGLKLEPILQPTIYYTRINYLTDLGLVPAPDVALVKEHVGDAMLRGIYPLSDTDVRVYQEGLFATLPFEDKWGVLNKIDGIDAMGLNPGKDVDKLLSLLESCRSLIVTGGTGATSRTFLYAWMRDNPINSNGWSSGCVGFGNTELTRYQRTFAHEFLHMCRWNWHFPDTSTLGAQVGWDLGPFLPSHPPGNGVPFPPPAGNGTAKPSSLRDISVPGKLTNEAWIDDGTYGWFVQNQFSCITGAASPPDTSPDALTVQGAFTSDGLTLVSLEPVFRYPWLVETNSLEAEGPYLVEVTPTEGEVVTRPFDAILGHDADAPEARGFFSVRVPFVGPAEVLRITDETGAIEYGRLTRSQSPPSITFTSPAAGAHIDSPVTVEWDPMDPDTPGFELRYQAAYSPDGGSSFVPIGVELETTSVVFDPGVVPQTQGPGAGLIRVFVSDGLNTAFADVDGLTVVGRLPRFIRGDANGDGEVNLTDGVFILGYLFLGGAVPPCLAAADSDADPSGKIDLTAAIYVLNHLFVGGPAPPEPYPTCGYSTGATDLTLGCASGPPDCQ